MNMMYLISFDTAQILGKLRLRSSPQHKMGLHPSSHGYIFGKPERQWLGACKEGKGVSFRSIEGTQTSGNKLYSIAKLLSRNLMYQHLEDMDLLTTQVSAFIMHLKKRETFTVMPRETAWNIFYILTSVLPFQEKFSSICVTLQIAWTSFAEWSECSVSQFKAHF